MTATDAWLRRLERDTVIVAGVLAAAALAAWPARPGRAAGVVGGVALIALSYQGIRAGVAGLRPAGEARRGSTGFVKFFTRHAILALGAYVMMARFEFDPMAMLVGVTSPAVAATVEIVRTIRARKSGPQSR